MCSWARQTEEYSWSVLITWTDTSVADCAISALFFRLMGTYLGMEMCIKKGWLVWRMIRNLLFCKWVVAQITIFFPALAFIKLLGSMWSNLWGFICKSVMWTEFRRLTGTWELTQIKDRCEVTGKIYRAFFLSLVRWAGLQSNHLFRLMCILKVTIFHDHSLALYIRWYMFYPHERWQKLQDWTVADRRQAALRSSPAAEVDWVSLLAGFLLP